MSDSTMTKNAATTPPAGQRSTAAGTCAWSACPNQRSCRSRDLCSVRVSQCEAWDSRREDMSRKVRPQPLRPAPAAPAAPAAPPRRRHPGRALIAAGALLIAAALALAAYGAWDAWRAADGAAALLEQVEAASGPDAAFATTNNGEGTTAASGLVVVDGRTYVGVLSLPSLGIELPVQSSWSYAGLRVSPCVYAGSAAGCNLVIAAHNYPAHFGNIKQLRAGDKLTFTDFAGQAYTYKVVATDVLAPRDISLMTQADGWDLTLFTCTLGGRSRVTVRAMQV